jgi:prepilin-type N-terminal cleavage/methylation domain-containing protein
MNVFHIYRRGFTLIELLVVVALMSLLMALGMPALYRMARGNKVEECARNIKLGLEQAQLRAASERRYVAVIFPNGANADVSSELQRYRLGGFRLAYVTRAAGGGFTFKRWVDPAWRNAPSGAILARVDNSEFTPSGGYVTGCTTAAANVLEGVTKTETEGDTTTTTTLFSPLASLVNDSGTSISAGNNCAIIFSPYGGTLVGANLHLLVSEAEINGGVINYPSGGTTSGRTANYFILKVNNLTGRVEYE